MSHAFRHERSFGLLIGGIFAALGAWWIYRNRFGPVAPWGLAVGLALMLLGAVAPKLLVHPHRAWMAFAEKLSWVSTRLILAVVYFLVLTPIGLMRRLVGADPLRRRGGPVRSSWHPYPARHLDSRHYEKGF